MKRFLTFLVTILIASNSSAFACLIGASESRTFEVLDQSVVASPPWTAAVPGLTQTIDLENCGYRNSTVSVERRASYGFDFSDLNRDQTLYFGLTYSECGDPLLVVRDPLGQFYVEQGATFGSSVREVTERFHSSWPDAGYFTLVGVGNPVPGIYEVWLGQYTYQGSNNGCSEQLYVTAVDGPNHRFAYGSVGRLGYTRP